MAEQPVQRFYWPENAIDWPEPIYYEDSQTSKVSTQVALIIFYFVTTALKLPTGEDTDRKHSLWRNRSNKF